MVSLTRWILAAQRGHERNARRARFRPQRPSHRHLRDGKDPVRVHRGRRGRHGADHRGGREPATAAAADGSAAVRDATTGRP